MPRFSARTWLVLILVALPLLSVGWQGVRTLDELERVEQERDTWQRPDDVIRALELRPGDAVVDFGSGAGYFALRLAPVVGRTGRVIALDIRRQPLAFLWIRSVLKRQWQVDVQLGEQSDPHVPNHLDAALIVNTYHELTNPSDNLERLAAVLKAGGRLVVADRRPRGGPGGSRETETASHRLSPGTASAEIVATGFKEISRDDDFIDRPSDDPWWLLVFGKTSPP